LSGFFLILAIRSAADDHAGLRSAEQLVAAEGDEVGAGCDGFAHRGFARQAPLAHVDQRAAAEVHHERQGARMGEWRHLGFRHGLGEAAIGIVAAVDLHQQRGAGR
jgi:hypothetical protein